MSVRAARYFRAARNGTTFFKTEIGVTPITNLDASFEALEDLTVSAGATNMFDKFPDKRNDAYRAAQFAANYNGAVGQYPWFSPFGINAAY
jgi:iron complex outermembrane receptor protein